MLNRSNEFWLAAFFLSKFGNKNKQQQTLPPIELETDKWNEAYRMFYEKLGGGRTISAFEHSMKNARDSYDSHIETSNRIGWRDQERKPNTLSNPAKTVYDRYSSLDRKSVWNELLPFVNKNVVNYSKVFDDLISIENSETDTNVVSKTEGGKKIIISYRYERNPSLRNDAFRIHGYDCAVCGFNFSKFYGVWGKDFGEVHHIILLSSLANSKIETNPQSDLAVVCANCHRMLHRRKGMTLTIQELKAKLMKVKAIQ